jgi:hypothetical protein
MQPICYFHIAYYCEISQERGKPQPSLETCAFLSTFSFLAVCLLFRTCSSKSPEHTSRSHQKCPKNKWRTAHGRLFSIEKPSRFAMCRRNIFRCFAAASRVLQDFSGGAVERGVVSGRNRSNGDPSDQTERVCARDEMGFELLESLCTLLQGERLLGTPHVSRVFSGLLMTTAPVTQQLRLLTKVVYSSASNFLLESGTSCHPSPSILLFKAP